MCHKNIFICCKIHFLTFLLELKRYYFKSANAKYVSSVACALRFTK